MSDMVYISHLISIVNDQKLLDYNRLSQIIRNKKKKHLVRVCSHRALPLAVPRPWVGHFSLDRGFLTCKQRDELNNLEVTFSSSIQSFWRVTPK